jgi:PAS domain S-box-containing protein
MQPTARDDTEQLYRLLAEEAVAYAIVFFDLDGVIRQWNSGAERLFGYTADEAIGRRAELLFLPEDVRDGVPRRELRTAAETGQADDRRWKARKDGTRFFADGIMFALHGADGEVVAFAKIIRDATEEKSIEEFRAASESQLRLIVDSIHDYAIYMLDVDGTIETWSRGAERIKGYSAAEVIGQNFALFYPPEDAAAGKPARQLRIAAENGTYEDESTHVRKDGSRFWASVVVSAIRDGAGALRGFVNLTHDVSERKRNEERAAFLAETSRVLAASIDYDRTLRQIAKLAVARIAEWCIVDLFEDEERVLTRMAVEHADPAKVQLAHELEAKYPPDASAPGIREVLEERKMMFYPEIPDAMLQTIARDAEHLRILRELGLRSAIITPLVAADRVLGMLTFVTSGRRRLANDDVTLAEDVAARAAVAVQNAQLYREAQEANRAKDEFLATVSHELRTPMTAVLGWAKLLRRETDPAIVAEAARAIERSAASQAQLIDDILDVARIRVGKLRMRFEETNLGEVVESAVEMVRLSAEAKRIRLQVKIDGHVMMVRGDAQRLQQVVWNLLSNAVKFTPEGGRIDVVLEQRDSVARLTVHDSGPGIPPEFVPHLFERFRQAESSQRRSHQGLGLGLSIAHYIVEAHSGTIRPQPGGNRTGATFIVELPTLGKDIGERTGTLRRRATDETESLRAVSVLVVEDDGDTLRYFTRALERAGAEVRVASSVDEALRVFADRVPDVVVSDVAMPGKTGYELLRAIRADERGANVPVIAVTASGIGGDRERALSAGFAAYLRKPVEPHDLVAAVRSCARETR